MHLFERECSVQRRHQKVIEESPSPAVTPELRSRITGAAVQAAAAVGYRNAGTIEFLLERPSGAGAEPRFHFLEMNTRLQVEHPVTEEVTGLDLVRAPTDRRVRRSAAVADGRPHSVATPSRRACTRRIRSTVFCPRRAACCSTVSRVRPACGSIPASPRATEVPVHYDPLLAKVIASAETRELARARLTAALRDFPILGIRTNVPFLLRILDDARFRSGDVDTTFLDSSMDSGGSSLAEPAAVDPPDFVLAAMAAVDDPADTPAQGVEPRRAWDPWQQLRDWRPPPSRDSAEHRRPRDGPSGTEAACARHVLRRRRRAAGNRLSWPDRQTIAGHSGTATSSIWFRRTNRRGSPTVSGASRRRSRCRRRCRRR